MKVLVLGAYGLIGQAIVRQLVARGDEVYGLARSVNRAKRLLPNVRWLQGDLNELLKPKDWSGHVEGVDGIVNASGALQSGPRDDLGRVQRDAIVALIKACEQAGVRRFVQVSAPGAAKEAATEFLATKGEADAALRESALGWVILKPGLVISETAYGGTSMVRMLAAFPVVQPIALADARLQTIGVRDVAAAVARSLEDDKLLRSDFELLAPETQNLEQIVLTFRAWLGFSVPRYILRLPVGLAMVAGRVADLAGWLGWRAPLRTTALKVLADDVVGDGEPWRRATGQEFGTLAQTLQQMPATRQERVFARVQLAFPLLVFLFALFWIASGGIALCQLDAAAAHISGQVGAGPAYLAVIGGALMDFAIGCGLLMRRTFVIACVASIVVSLLYLLLGSILSPQLWTDPLGPLVKIGPVLGLAIALLAMAEER